MNHKRKILCVLVLATVLSVTLFRPAYAFDGRGGDKVVIESSEVVDDDLYVTAQEFVLDGTVNGDLIVFAQIITINGTVDGNLMAAGQTVVLNGTVTGSARMAGSVVFIGEEASVGGDVVSAGYSLEAREGSAIGRDLVFAGGQTRLAGDITRNLQVATGALELRGAVGGDVKAEVGDAAQGGPPPNVFMPQSTVPIPSIKPGLSIDPSARIAGNLEYTQAKELTFPAGVLGGKAIHTVSETARKAATAETSAQKVGKWALGFARDSVTLILIGLLVLWLSPSFIKALGSKLQTRPWPSLGWGVVAWAAFFFALFLVVVVMVLGGILFGVLTLGQLSGTVIWVGLLTLFALVTGFVLVTSFVVKVVFGLALGEWLLARAHSPLAVHKYLPMVIGVLITVAVIALLSFPLIPGFLGGLLNFAVVLFGLGALWLWGRDRMARQPASQTEPQPG